MVTVNGQQKERNLKIKALKWFFKNSCRNKDARLIVETIKKKVNRMGK